MLGIAHDGGARQAGTIEHPGRPSARMVCFGLVDPQPGQRWLFDATPDFHDQYHMLDSPSGTGRLNYALHAMFPCSQFP